MATAPRQENEPSSENRAGWGAAGDSCDASSSTDRPKVTNRREQHPVSLVVTVIMSGDIDIATSPAMQDALVTGPDPAHLEVDMSAVTFMDASGIGVLLAARQRAVDGGGSLILRSPGWAVRRLTAVLGLDELLVTR